MTGAVVYISSNREPPKFENAVIRDMLSKKGDLPVFSVTQKPMDLGTNKCVGDVGTSGFNFCRQLQMVTKLADVDYVISCEADCLYPPDYYTFVPPRLDTVYRNDHNFVIGYKKDYFSAKKSQTAFQVAGRDFLLSRLNFLLKDQPQWNTEMKNFPKEIGKPFLEGWDTFHTEYACLTIKTGDAMRRHTAAGSTKVYEIPYWGSAKGVKEKYL